MYKMYKFNNMNKKILTFALLCGIFKITIKVVSLGELRLAQVSFITTHLVQQCVVMTFGSHHYSAWQGAVTGRFRQP